MGTNYYLSKDVCGHCGRGEEPLHIGKSSGGWCFSLHVDNQIKSLSDWQSLFNEPGNVIKNEYGETISPLEMFQTICERRGYRLESPTADFLERNFAEIGPHQLLRHKKMMHNSNYGCIGHGDGTYDLITGVFS